MVRAAVFQAWWWGLRHGFFIALINLFGTCQKLQVAHFNRLLGEGLSAKTA
jgi:hypothetical protein